jgi:hypothetical protein
VVRGFTDEASRAFSATRTMIDFTKLPPNLGVFFLDDLQCSGDARPQILENQSWAPYQVANVTNNKISRKYATSQISYICNRLVADVTNNENS